MARGGARRGTPGTAYGARTDLHQPVKVADGGEYGSRKMLEQAQDVVPLPQQPPVPAPRSRAVPVTQPAVAAAPAPIALAPGDLDFTRPTERPDEPVTAGLPMGPGPGPEVLNLPSDASATAGYLRSMYANVPDAQNPDFLRLVEMAEQQSWR